MIDVALKVGELIGGMAEGSVVTFLTKPQPLSSNMKTVYAMLRMDESQLPLLEDAIRPGRSSPRRLRMPLRTLARALSRPDLERQWRSRKPVQPVDVSRLELRKLMRRGYKVKTPKHRDVNAISSGYRTVGVAGAYADWNAALADIATSISGQLVFIQISDLSYYMYGTTGSISLTSANARIICKSASPLKGNGAAGLQIEDTVRDYAGFKIIARNTTGEEGPYVEIKDLYFKSKDTSSPATPYPFIELEGFTDNEDALFKVHDCIFFGNGKQGYGLRRADNRNILHLWNCKFSGFTSNAGIYLSVASNTESLIENCILKGNNTGITQTVNSTVKINNCVGISSLTEDFDLFSAQGSKGDNNVSTDASADDFDGTDNLASQSGLDNEFYAVSTPEAPGFFRLLPTATLLPSAGKAPEIPDNDSGCIGNSRPGTDGEYSAGADELEEVFPDNWNVYTKLTISADKVTGVSPFFMPVLITEKAFMITDEIWINSREDGGDLRITTDLEGQSIRALEVVTWDRVNRKCELWALISVDPDDDTEIYLWAGNPRAAQPEFNDNRDYRGQFGVWQYDTFTQGFVLHCANDRQERYAYDSSAHKSHCPIYYAVMEQIDGPWGYGKALYFWEDLNRYLYWNVYSEFTQSESHGFALMHVKKALAGACGLMNLDTTSGVDRRFMLEDKASTKGFSVTATAPDGGTPQTKDSDIASLSDLQPHIVGGVVDLPNNRIDTWVDGVKVSGSVSFGASNFSSGTHNPADIGDSRTGGPARFWGQEIRYRAKDAFGGIETDGFWETHYTMIQDQAGFWSCGDLYGQSQEGPRKWQFLVPEVGCFGIENTDFWVEYTANVDGTLSAILHAVWDAGSHRDLTGLAKRVELEGRLEELRHIFETLRGDLLIDAGTAYEKLIRGVQLSGVTLNEGKTNAALDYDVTFVIGLAGLGMRGIARDLEFGESVLNAANFLVEYAGSDGTVFKDVFRAAPIRVPTGPTIKSVLVSAVVESVSASTPLGRRQRTEAIVKEWAWNRLGSEGELTIDGESLGTAHLASVQPSNLELPDAVVYDLEFLTGYGS